MTSEFHNLPILTTEQMIEVDRLMIEEWGITLFQMMENAGRNFAELARRQMGGTIQAKSVVVLCGQGKNGGGGMTAARHLHNWGASVDVILIGNEKRLKDVPAHQWRILQKMGITRSAIELSSADLILDAMLGYGAKGDPRPPVPIIPAATSDLVVTQRADKVILAWSYPSLTTVGRSLTDVRRITVIPDDITLIAREVQAVTGLTHFNTVRVYDYGRADDGSFYVLHAGKEDTVDRWIRMVATNRLTGHSPGFFSVYTLPPNQAVSPEDQMRINARLRQEPEYRDIRALILKKSMQLQGRLSAADRWRLRTAAETVRYLERDAAATPEITDGSVHLTVTSPPFLDVVQYARDNWLRCWFNGLDADAIDVRITASRTVKEWEMEMSLVFRELYRVTRPGGWVAFEVGEVRRGSVKLEEVVAPLGIAAGFQCSAILINAQSFTKTANIWGVANNRLGTNSNRIVLFRKP